jgi:hypothetical protein
MQILSRTARLAACALACSAALASTAAGPDVTILNVPLPVTGSVNANITNASVPVSGTVSVSSLPSVHVSSLPAVQVSSLPAVQVSGLPAIDRALPASPFFDEMTLLNGGDRKAVGVAGQRLGVTTITVSNFDSSDQQLFVFNPVMSGADCTGTVIGGSTPILRALLEARKTVQFQFPTPMVFSLSGLGCIAAEVTTVMSGGSVVVDVVGYTGS